jgi:hypothetical protein
VSRRTLGELDIDVRHDYNLIIIIQFLGNKVIVMFVDPFLKVGGCNPLSERGKVPLKESPPF